MSFAHAKQTLDALAATHPELVQQLRALDRRTDAAAIRQLMRLREKCGYAVRMAHEWRGEHLRSLRLGIAAARDLEQRLDVHTTRMQRRIGAEFSIRSAELSHSPSRERLDAILDLCGRYTMLGQRAHPEIERFLEYSQTGTAESTTTLHQAYARWYPVHRFERRHLLLAVEGTNHGVWEDVERALGVVPKVYARSGVAALQLPVGEADRMRERLDRLCAKLKRYAIGMHSAPASIVSIPELTLPWLRVKRSADEPYNLANIGAPEAWQTTKGEGSSIAVIDTGADYTHQELLDRFGSERGYNFVDDTDDPMDDNEHGTHVSGTVAGRTRGVAPAAQLYALKVLNADGYGSMADVLRAMEWVMDYNEEHSEKICAVSLSLGSRASNTIEEAMCRTLYQSGVAIIAAAGNEGRGPSYPASYPNVISVAAVDRWNEHADFSNIWHTTDIAAPGVDVNSCVPNGYASFSGTSMATPHISGIAALAHSVLEQWSPERFEQQLKKGAQQIGMGEDEHEGKYGAGLGRADQMVKQEVRYGKMVCGL